MKYTVKKSEYHHGNLKQALLAAATEIVAEEGHKSLTLKAVADRLGVSSPSLYRHYKSREDLLLSVSAETLSKLDQLLLEALRDCADKKRRPAVAAETIIDFGQANPNLYQLINELETPGEHLEGSRARQAVDDTIDSAFLDAYPELGERQLRIQALLMWFSLYGFFAVQRNQPTKGTLVDKNELTELRSYLVCLATGVVSGHSGGGTYRR